VLNTAYIIILSDIRSNSQSSKKWISAIYSIRPLPSSLYNKKDKARSAHYETVIISVPSVRMCRHILYD
jgi:hypothetical protein